MGFLFHDPILGYAEKHLLDLAKKRYIEQGHSLPDDIEAWSHETKRTVFAIRDNLMGQEKAALKAVRKRLSFDRYKFNAVVKEVVADALRRSFEDSSDKWYAEEKSYSPRILAVPLLIVRHRTRLRIPPLLSKKIQFEDLLPETIDAIADDSVDQYLAEVIEGFTSEYASLKIGIYTVLIAGVVKNDFYHIDTAPQVSRLDMLILSTFDSAGDHKRELKNKKASVKFWKNVLLKGAGQRPDDRRFTTSPWHLTSEQVQSLLVKSG